MCRFAEAMGNALLLVVLIWTNCLTNKCSGLAMGVFFFKKKYKKECPNHGKSNLANNNQNACSNNTFKFF